MDIFLLSNGKLSGNPQWLSYAQDRIRIMIKTRGIRSAVLIAYAVIRADHDQRARELSEALGIDVTCIDHFDSPGSGCRKCGMYSCQRRKYRC